MAGLKGPERNELDQLYPLFEPVVGRAGEVRAATGGSKDLPGVSLDEPAPPAPLLLPLKDCSNGLGSREKGL